MLHRVVVFGPPACGKSTLVATARDVYHMRAIDLELVSDLSTVDLRQYEFIGAGGCQPHQLEYLTDGRDPSDLVAYVPYAVAGDARAAQAALRNAPSA